MLSRSIMRLLPDSATTPSGTVTFEGADLVSFSPATLRKLWGPAISMVFQDPMTSLNPVVRVGRQITEVMRLHLGLSRSEARARALQLLSDVGIPAPERRMNSFPGELSGGMRQRVGIVIAMSCEPKLLIADEPTTALDVTVQRQILDLLGKLKAERDMAMILVFTTSASLLDAPTASP